MLEGIRTTAAFGLDGLTVGVPWACKEPHENVRMSNSEGVWWWRDSTVIAPPNQVNSSHVSGCRGPVSRVYIQSEDEDDAGAPHHTFAR